MQRYFSQEQIRDSTGEQLLLIAIFGHDGVKHSVDRELDRRAGLRPQIARAQGDAIAAAGRLPRAA